MTTTVSTRFLRNPDVVLREEDVDEGALLFNPDTNQVKVINPVGLLIWKSVDEAVTTEEIVLAIQENFDEAPYEQVHQDVQEFMDLMVASGFIGIVI